CRTAHGQLHQSRDRTREPGPGGGPDVGPKRSSWHPGQVMARATPPPSNEPPEQKPLAIGPLEVWPPVVLAPMAGVTNAPFRDLCRSHGAGLYVSEMISARGMVEGHEK